MKNTCKFFCDLLSASDLTRQASNNWTVELATELADAINFSSLAFPCTVKFAASHSDSVATATNLAYITKLQLTLRNNQLKKS